MKARSLPCKQPGRECSRMKAWESGPGGEREGRKVWRGRWGSWFGEAGGGAVLGTASAERTMDPLLHGTRRHGAALSRAVASLEVHCRHPVEAKLWRARMEAKSQ